MARTIAFNQPFNILIVGQAGRLQYEALLFVASLKAMSPTLKGRIFVAEPQFTNRWEKDPRMLGDIRDAGAKDGVIGADMEVVSIITSGPP